MSTKFNYGPTFRGILKQALANGYNLQYATLEFTDNSLSKRSSEVQVILEKTETKPYMLDRLTVFDDGDGMTSQSLKESFVIAGTKDNREDDDIGAFCVGMKYAAMNIGSNITIISKTQGGSIVGLHANVEQMKVNNAFDPTEFCPSVVEEWAMKFLSPGHFDKFNLVQHGTMIHISGLRPKSVIRFEHALDELNKGLGLAYSSLYNDCTMSLYDGHTVHSVIRPIDMFYDSSPEKLDEDAYQTQIDVYRGPFGTERVIEVNTMKRPYANKKTTSGRIGSPQFIEWSFGEMPSGRKKPIPKILNRQELPDSSDLIGTIFTRTIQVNQASYDSEKNYFPEGTPLHRDRKRFWFHRGIRCVAAGNSIGKKIDDRVSTNSERQRTQVKFTPATDDLIGSKFNKQMDNKELPCRLLGDVIFGVHRAITGAWNANWKDETTVPSQDDRSEEEEEKSPPVNPFIALYRTEDVVIPVTNEQPVEAVQDIPEPIQEFTEPVQEPNEVVQEAPVTRDAAFLEKFGITIDRHMEQVAWLKSYDN